jgi:hypothetical protein
MAATGSVSVCRLSRQFSVCRLSRQFNVGGQIT